MINRYTISHLSEIYENNFIEGVFKTFKIPKQDDYTKMTYRVTDNSIYIESDKIKYTINIFIDEEYYEIRKEFKNYSIIEMYSLEKELLSKSMAYPINDKEKTLIEELDSGEFKARRFVITSKDDETYLDGHYEKMITEYNQYNIYEDYEYRKSKKNEELKHTFDMDNNCYYHNYYKSEKPLLEKETSVLIESSMVIDKPVLFVVGKTKYDNNMLIDSMKLGKPNILIKGIYKSGNNSYIFSLNITKENNKYSTKFSYQINDNTKNNTFELKCNKGHITKEEIEKITEYIKDNYNLTFVPDIINCLKKIKKVTEVYENRNKKELDFITLKLRIFNNINDLIYDYYFNINKYLDKIKNSTLKFTK